MDNHATYHGTAAEAIRELYDGTLFNWDTNAAVINLGLGLDYHWTLLGRPSSVKADVYHTIVDSFAESDAAVKFTERANMLAVKADMIFPTEFKVDERRLDLVLLLGVNDFFGENRRTLGYTTSYQAGMGGEFPLRWNAADYGFLRLSG